MGRHRHLGSAKSLWPHYSFDVIGFGKYLASYTFRGSTTNNQRTLRQVAENKPYISKRVLVARILEVVFDKLARRDKLELNGLTADGLILPQFGRSATLI